MKKILILDNYDSFTYNLVQMVEEIIGGQIDVYRNDQIGIKEVGQYDKIILSPGPGIPAEAGILLELIQTYANSKSILGVCLGHQAIGQAFGGQLVNLSKVYHGIKTPINLIPDLELSQSGNDWFNALDSTIDVGRYHSWVVDEKIFPKELEITAVDASGMIMALRHRKFDIQGVQFHPESVLTPFGRKMLENWLASV